jgi:hypothetical protein
MDKPDTISVNVKVERKVYASRVDMCVEIRGESLVSGSAALQKAREVRDLVAALADVRIPESCVQVVGIRTAVSSGIITKSSSAVYSLRIEVPSLDLLADALGAVTSRKNASLTRLEWQYSGIEELHHQMLEEALRRSEQRAALICRELRHGNLGVHGLTETFSEDQDNRAEFASFGAPLRARAANALSKEDLGLEVTHSKTVTLGVRVEYRVEPRREQTPAVNSAR